MIRAKEAGARDVAAHYLTDFDRLCEAHPGDPGLQKLVQWLRQQLPETGRQ